MGPNIPLLKGSSSLECTQLGLLLCNFFVWNGGPRQCLNDSYVIVNLKLYAQTHSYKCLKINP